MAARALGYHGRASFSVDDIYYDLDRRVAADIRRASGQFDAVYAYEDGALETFREATKLGLTKFYELPIGYWRTFAEIARVEIELEPEYAATIQMARDVSSSPKYQRKDQELRLADSIVVASTFTKATLASVPTGSPRNVMVVPYGFPAPPVNRRSYSQNRPLRVLFVGQLTQRKGVSYLFNAVRQMRSAVSLTVVGRLPTPCPVIERELQKHQYYPSLPHSRILDLMESCDVLVFPSLFEGFGLVITEAMSRGMVVVASTNTAAPDLIEDGVDGYIVPIRDTDAICRCLQALGEDHQLLADVGDAATRKARSRTWESYRGELIEGLSVQRKLI